MSDYLTDSTNAEFAYMLQHGMEPMTLDELRARGAAIGYRLDTCRRTTLAAGRYINNLNERTYRALGVTWTDTRTGEGFANVRADRSNLPALQELRRSAAVLHRGHIVEC